MTYANLTVNGSLFTGMQVAAVYSLFGFTPSFSVKLLYAFVERRNVLEHPLFVTLWSELGYMNY